MKVMKGMKAQLKKRKLMSLMWIRSLTVSMLKMKKMLLTVTSHHLETGMS